VEVVGVYPFPEVLVGEVVHPCPVGQEVVVNPFQVVQVVVAAHPFQVVQVVVVGVHPFRAVVVVHPCQVVVVVPFRAVVGAGCYYLHHSF
jgi:hypothetical protein